MATYDELYTLFQSSALRNRIEVACVVAARTIQAEDAGVNNHANRLLWAKAVQWDSRKYAKPLLNVLLADKKNTPLEEIMAVSSATLQDLVDSVVDIFADGS